MLKAFNNSDVLSVKGKDKLIRKVESLLLEKNTLQRKVRYLPIYHFIHDVMVRRRSPRILNVEHEFDKDPSRTRSLYDFYKSELSPRNEFKIKSAMDEVTLIGPIFRTPED